MKYEKNVLRQPHSKSAFRLESHDNEGLLSSATGFFFEINDTLYIITNWHVVSGKHFLTNVPLSASGRLPTRLVAHFAMAGEPKPDGRIDVGTVQAPIAIYGPDRLPLWSEHPSLGPLCDIVALPVGGSLSSSNLLHKAANLVEASRVPVEPGCAVFVIGYPRSLMIGPGLPLWKSGYVASETTFDVSVGGQMLPAFFIDSQTREGMSGSPVFAHYVGIWNPEDPHAPVREQELLKHDWGRGIEFIGCYSGRLGPEEEGAALGLCWREDTLREVCIGGTRGEHPHIVAAELD